ncbi:MAG: hypothetical protein OEM62_05925 [Acidobacteriota bacterium]|nr:hypothetical protein [Acidobacteriota bacterium]
MKNTSNTTMRTWVWLLTLALGAVMLGAAHGQTPRPEANPIDWVNPIDCEPLVVYDISGYGIGGAIHEHLAVYSDGLASVASLSPGGFFAEVTWVTPERAREFNDELIAAGALELPDRRTDGVADFPMTTVTVFNGSQQNAVHNVFSFYDIGEARDYEAVVGIVEAFIGETFASGGTPQ